MPAPASYSRSQIVLHWLVALLILPQFLLGDGIKSVWRALRHGQAVTAGAMAQWHVYAGMAILVLVLGRLFLRWQRGMPAIAAEEPALLRWAARLTHGGLYLLILALPISGLLAWYGGIRSAAEIHQLAKTLLLSAVALHVLGALVQHFVLRSGVLIRMFRPQ